MVQLYAHAATIPMKFFTDENYKGMSNNAKLLYGLLAERLEDEIETAWIWRDKHMRRDYGERDATRDESGNICIHYPTEELASLLNVRKSTVAKLFQELEAANLIMRKKSEPGKPDNIYVGLAKNKDSPYYEGD